MRFPTRNVFSTIFLASSCVALLSCSDDNDGVRVYEVVIPPNAGAGTANNPSTPAMMPPTSSAPSPEISWNAPASWKKVANANRFDRARYEINDGKAILSVTAGIGGSIPMNVNRWRGQLGLTAAGEDELKSSAIPVTTPVSKGVMFELAAPDGSRKILAAILPVPNDTYYFKLDGESASVDAARADFEATLKTFGGDAEPAKAHDHSDHSDHNHAEPAAPEPTPELALTAPTGWTAAEKDTSGTMRAASYTTANGNEVAVLRFKSAPDSILQNVNIWRQELALPAFTDFSELQLTTVEGELKWQTHRVETAAPEAPAILAAFASQGDTLWVVRMRGTSDSISKDSEAFETLITSAKSK